MSSEVTQRSLLLFIAGVNPVLGADNGPLAQLGEHLFCTEEDGVQLPTCPPNNAEAAGAVLGFQPLACKDQHLVAVPNSNDSIAQW